MTMQPKAYHVFQLIHLLSNDTSIDTAIQLQAARKLGFPSSDIDCVSKNHLGQWIISLNFLGLSGVDSSLPQEINRILSKEENQALRDLLDKTNHLFYHRLYQLWLKHHPLFLIQQKQSWYVQAFHGLSTHSLNKVNLAEHPLINGFCHTIRTTNNLIRILQQLLDEKTIQIGEYYPTWQTVVNTTRLNDTAYIGDNALLGTRVLNVSMTIALHIHIQNIEKTKELLLGKPLNQKLLLTLQQFLITDFSYRLVITTPLNPIQSPILDNQTSPSLEGFTSLGHTSTKTTMILNINSHSHLLIGCD